MHLELEDESTHKNKEKEGLETEHIATLERLKANQRQDYLQVCYGFYFNVVIITPRQLNRNV